jgi:hypothetical protein
VSYQRLIFGVNRDPGVREEATVSGGARNKSGALRANPMLAVAGPGPAGERCERCRHLYQVGGTAGRYYKCDLRRVSASAATDHRVRWPACGRFERLDGHHPDAHPEPRPL